MPGDAPPNLIWLAREVRALRISTAEGGGQTSSETVPVVVEAPTTIDVGGVGRYTLLCTPDDNRALAWGFLLSEGIINSRNDVAVLRECATDPTVIRVTLRRQRAGADAAGRNLLIVSSCGLCGAEDLSERLDGLSTVGDSLRVDGGVLRTVGDRLSDHQPAFRVCGGTHGAGIFTAGGEFLATAEDAGRHNALDKAIGRCLIADLSPAGCGAALSGRVSLEMVIKCARAGIELICAISAPTSLAVQVADRCGITLCAFVREDRATVFTHPRRITSSPQTTQGLPPAG